MNQGLNNYKKAVYSQWGEDGIIEELFKRIGTKNKICIEFGAGDGFECSNIWNLIKNSGWQGLLMEPDINRYNKWPEPLKTVSGTNTKILNTTVDIEGENSLENILERNNIPKDVDLLSIDIDGDDYHILNSIKKFTPRVILIEHNPSIPITDHVVQKPGEKHSFGASAKAVIDLAHEKGYQLVAMTLTNCLFVQRDEFAKVNIQEPALAEVFDGSGLSYVISTYDGSLYFKNENNSNKPIFGGMYKTYNLTLNKTSFYTFSYGPSLNIPYSETLAEKYQPMKIFRDAPGNVGGFIYFLKSLFKLLSKKDR